MVRRPVRSDKEGKYYFTLPTDDDGIRRVAGTPPDRPPHPDKRVPDPDIYTAVDGTLKAIDKAVAAGNVAIEESQAVVLQFPAPDTVQVVRPQLLEVA